MWKVRYRTAELKPLIAADVAILMDTSNRDAVFDRDNTSESVCTRMLLGRLGAELADLYGQVIDCALPAELRALVEQLDGIAPQSRASAG
jgi:hypothetical protein